MGAETGLLCEERSRSSTSAPPPMSSSAPNQNPPSTTTTTTSTSQPTTQLDAFLTSLDSFQPSIPPSLINHYLAKSGLTTTDKKTLNLISLATQKFLSDVCSDAYHYLPKESARTGATAKNRSDRGKFVLRGEYLEKCLENYGVDVRRRRFFVEKEEQEDTSEQQG